MQKNIESNLDRVFFIRYYKTVILHLEKQLDSMMKQAECAQFIDNDSIEEVREFTRARAFYKNLLEVLESI